MSVVHVHQLNLVFVVDEVNLSNWNYAIFPHFVLTEVQILATVDPHEDYVILFRLAVLTSLVPPLLEANFLSKCDWSLGSFGKRVLI